MTVIERNSLSPVFVENPWATAIAAFRKALRESLMLVVLAVLTGAALAGAAKAILPPRYEARAQVLIDPRGVNVKAGDLFSQLDANAAINFVESQMVVLRSDRVLNRAIAELMSPKREEDPTSTTPDATTGENPAPSKDAETRAIETLRRSLSVARGDRSFVVSVAVENADRQIASEQANAIVKAFMEIDVIDRSELAKRLRTEFDNRLDGLQESVREASLAVETFRRASGLFGANDHTSIEWQLKQTIEALTVALVREDESSVRLRMFEAKPMALDILGPLRDDALSRNMTVKIEALNKAQAEEAALAGVLGKRHPQLQQARAAVATLTNDLNELLNELRKSAASDLERYGNQVRALQARSSELSDRLSKARASEIELKALEVELDGRKKILDAFQSRYREIREFGDIDTSNVRLISPARPPVELKPIIGIIKWSVAGGIIALLLACALLCLSAPLRLLFGEPSAAR